MYTEFGFRRVVVESPAGIAALVFSINQAIRTRVSSELDSVMSEASSFYRMHGQSTRVRFPGNPATPYRCGDGCSHEQTKTFRTASIRKTHRGETETVDNFKKRQKKSLNGIPSLGELMVL